MDFFFLLNFAFSSGYTYQWCHQLTEQHARQDENRAIFLNSISSESFWNWFWANKMGKQRSEIEMNRKRWRRWWRSVQSKKFRDLYIYSYRLTVGLISLFNHFTYVGLYFILLCLFAIGTAYVYIYIYCSLSIRCKVLLQVNNVRFRFFSSFSLISMFVCWCVSVLMDI